MAQLLEPRTGARTLTVLAHHAIRICFVWTPEGPVAVEITDYH